MKKYCNHHTFYIALILLNLFPCFSHAQEANYVSGQVKDGATGLPVTGCSVYFNNTSKGGITSSSGEFILKNLPVGTYEMIISAIGYETEVIQVSSKNYPHKLQVILHIRSQQLSEVTIQPFLKNGWAIWGQTFLKNFIGSTTNASHCYLINHEAVKFWFSEKNNRLTARADEPLIIENDALGYIIKFRLEEFSIDFNSNLIRYFGYPFFQEMAVKRERKEIKWKENRKEAYYGSLVDFLRSIYNDRWLESGFQIVTFVKRYNVEKQRVKTILQPFMPVSTDSVSRNSNANLLKALTRVNRDSSSYYKRILKQPDSSSGYISLTNLDSSLLINEDKSKTLFFNGKWEIFYRRLPQSKPQHSEIYLFTPEPVRIEENGSYSSRVLFTGLYWALSEKISNLLPLDYEP